MALKDLIFQKGGIGKAMSRQETVERLNPLIEQHMALNHYHNYVIEHTGEADIAERLATLQKRARMDVGKIMESVFSAGGVAYNGVAMDPEDFRLSEDDNEMLFDLFDRERAFRETLEDELELDHQIRTQAILNNVLANSNERLNFLKDITKRRRRTRPADA